MSRVLAAVDLSPLARRVAERARMVAETDGSDLTLLHVLEPLADTFVAAPVADRLRAHRTKEAETLAEWVRERSSSHVDVVVERGSPDWEIVRHAKRGGVVVIGSSSVDSMRVGPVTRRVAEMAHADILVVRRQPRVPYRRVVAAVDFSEGSVQAVECALRLSPDADVTLVYALPTRFDVQLIEAGWFPEEIDDSHRVRLDRAEEAMAEFIHRWEGRVRTIVTDGPAPEVVGEVARRRSADLVTVASRGAGATKMVLLGTVAGQVMGAVPCDVAVARVRGDFRRP